MEFLIISDHNQNNMKDRINLIEIDDKVQSFYVRTQIEYNANSDYSLPKKGISFEIGEILFIKNSNDIDWWCARKLNPLTSGSIPPEEGIIPSATRLLKKHFSKEIIVNFDEKTTVIEPNGSQTSDKINSGTPAGSGSIDLKRKRQQASLQPSNLQQSNVPKNGQKKSLNDFYEIVESTKALFPRPLVAIGPGRSKLYDQLILNYPNYFASPVNHTTRPKRHNEVEGIDYHFIEDKDQFTHDKENGLFIETVEYNGNFYGTSLLAVKNVMESKRHCIIDATFTFIKNLEQNDIQPISILINPDTINVAKRLMGEQTSEKLVKNSMQYSSMLNSKERKSFDVKLNCQSMDELVKETYTAVMNCQKWGLWNRVKDQSGLNSYNTKL